MIAESMLLADWLCVVAWWALLFTATAIIFWESGQERPTGPNRKD